MSSPNAKAGRLYIVATPIGNLRDITLRAIDTLKEVVLICCEDTRHASILLKAHGISTPTLSYHEHNGERIRPLILERLAEGQQIALISDAGTPLISDPGYKLVNEARVAGYPVIPIPGASAAMTALCAAGLPTDQFHFCGFLPPKSSARRQKMETLRAIPGTLVFYESPRRLAEFLTDAAAELGAERKAVIARELTKTYEEFRQGTLQALASHYAEAGAPKGEVVVLIAPQAEPLSSSEEDIDHLLRQALMQHSVKEAAELVAKASARPKREIYQRALIVKGQ